jgi:hypothetical protein
MSECKLDRDQLAGTRPSNGYPCALARGCTDPVVSLSPFAIDPLTGARCEGEVPSVSRLALAAMREDHHTGAVDPVVDLGQMSI